MGKLTERHPKGDSGVGAGTGGSPSEWVRFTLQVQSVYKRSQDSRLRRGQLTLYVHAADLACKCPKLKANRSYLILGRESDGGRQGALTATQRSIVIEWRDEWHRRMRRFQRRARTCHRA